MLTLVAYAGHTSLLMGLSLVYFPDLYVRETPADTIEKGGKRKLKFLSLLKVHVYSDFTDSSLYCRNSFSIELFKTCVVLSLRSWPQLEAKPWMIYRN